MLDFLVEPARYGRPSTEQRYEDILLERLTYGQRPGLLSLSDGAK